MNNKPKPTYPCPSCQGSGSTCSPPDVDRCGRCDDSPAGGNSFFVEDRIWLTKENRKIRYRDLGDNHLINILRMLKKGAMLHQATKQAGMMTTPAPTASGANDAYMEEFDAVMNASWESFANKHFQYLKIYAEWRGLQWDDSTPAADILYQTGLTLRLVKKARPRKSSEAS
jgi:hypothetical protein